MPGLYNGYSHWEETALLLGRATILLYIMLLDKEGLKFSIFWLIAARAWMSWMTMDLHHRISLYSLISLQERWKA